MKPETEKSPSPTSPWRRVSDDERGMTLVLVLVISFFVSLLATSLLFTTDIEFRTSTNQTDAMESTNTVDAALTEVLYRLNLEPDNTTAAPDGSLITVNKMTDYDAAINPDEFGLLDNEFDDDGDGTVDEPDELNLNRDWTVRILITDDVPTASSPWHVVDTLATAGPPWGSKRVEATIQESESWKEYSTADPSDDDVLTIRFKLDKGDTSLGDVEGDGEEIVFYDPWLVINGVDDGNTLTGLGLDGDPDNDSPYNITYSDGVTTWPASGSPVLIIETTAKVRRGGKLVAEKKVLAEVYYPVRSAITKALCGCGGVTIGSSRGTDSYNSAEGDYGAGGPSLIYDNGDIGANDWLRVTGGVINGELEAGGWIDTTSSSDDISGNAFAGEAITESGEILGKLFPNAQPPPEPCWCDLFPVDDMVAEASITNDNNLLPAFYQKPNLKLSGGSTLSLNAGTYYWNSVDIGGSASLEILSGPVYIYVSKGLDLGGGGVVNNLSPTDLQFFVAAVSPEEVNIGGSSEFRGMIWAPYAEVDLHGSQDFKGAVVGETVNYNGSGEVHFDEALMETYRFPWLYRTVAWLEED